MASTERHETIPPQTPQGKQKELKIKAEEITRSYQKYDERRDQYKRIREVFGRG